MFHNNIFLTDIIRNNTDYFGANSGAVEMTQRTVQNTKFIRHRCLATSLAAFLPVKSRIVRTKNKELKNIIVEQVYNKTLFIPVYP